MTTTTAVPVTTGTFPRVDLLPPEIAEEARFRAIRAFLALAVVGAFLVVGLLSFMASSKVSSAEESLAATKVVSANLQVEKAKYANVPVVYAQVAAAETALQRAMAPEVRYSYVLNDFSLTIPDSVWMTSMAVSQDADGTQPVTGEWGTPGIGKIQFDGVAFTHKNVASWLDVLAKNDQYTDPYFTKSDKSKKINDQLYVEYTTTVTLTDQALSNRYTKAGS